MLASLAMLHPLEEWRLKEQERRGERLPRYKLAKELRCFPSQLTALITYRDLPTSHLALRIKALTGLSTDEIFAAVKEKPAQEAAE